MKAFLLSFVLCLSLSAYSQDSNNVYTCWMDTVTADSFHAKKIIRYESPGLTYLLDYNAVKPVFEKVLHGKISYYANLAGNLLNQLDKTLKTSDTAFLTHIALNDLKWVLEGDFLFFEIESKNCLIIDRDGNIHRTFIKYYWQQGSGTSQWGGYLFTLPGKKDYLVRYVQWEN